MQSLENRLERLTFGALPKQLDALDQAGLACLINRSFLWPSGWRKKSGGQPRQARRPQKGFPELHGRRLQVRLERPSVGFPQFGSQAAYSAASRKKPTGATKDRCSDNDCEVKTIKRCRSARLCRSPKGDYPLPDQYLAAMVGGATEPWHGASITYWRSKNFDDLMIRIQSTATNCWPNSTGLMHTKRKCSLPLTTN
jgi:hypothetical protein